MKHNDKPDEVNIPEEEIPETEAPETAAEEQAATPEKEEKASKKQTKAAEKSEIQVLKEQLTEQTDKYLRLAAEYDNYRRRSQKERENIYQDIRSDTVMKFLPIYDNLARAVVHETNEEDRKGMEAIFNQFKAILSSFGVTEIEAVGKKFDPSLHNAALHIDDEKYGEGEIVLELTKGFKMGDNVIRFSTVQVAN